MPFPIIAAAITAAGIAASLFGASQEKEKAQRTARQVNALLGQQSAFFQKASRASERAETLREKQMTLDAARLRRDIVRNVSLAKSVSLVRASGQGAALGSSSVFGSLGQIFSQGIRQTRDVNQNEEIGAGIFDANRDTIRAMSSANQIGTRISTVQNRAQANQGNFWSSLGSSLMSAAPAISNMGTSALFGSNTPWYSTPFGSQLATPSNWQQSGPNTWIGPAFPGA